MHAISASAHRLSVAAGVDATIAFTLINRVCAVLASPINIICISHFLSPVEQGLYYAFGSLLAAQVIFDLGMAYVVMQSASHEKAKLVWSGSLLVGDSAAKARLRSLFRLSVRYYAIAAMAMLVGTSLAGTIFFMSFTDQASPRAAWMVPWLLLVPVSSVGLFLSPFTAVLEGCGKVRDIAKLRMVQTVAASIALPLGLSAGFGLMTVVLLAATNAGICTIYLAKYQRQFISDLLRVDQDPARISWGMEIWPFQWRIAVSWLSGYIAYQLFTPIVFAHHGAVAAGRLGMTLGIVTAIANVAVSWVVTKAPYFGELAAASKNEDLRSQFRSAAFRSMAAYLVLSCILLCGIAILELGSFSIRDRMLSTLEVIILLTAGIANHVVTCLAVFIRAFRIEPFALYSAAVALIIVAASTLASRLGGIFGVVTAYALVCWAMMIVAVAIFKRALNRINKAAACV